MSLQRSLILLGAAVGLALPLAGPADAAPQRGSQADAQERPAAQGQSTPAQNNRTGNAGQTTGRQGAQKQDGVTGTGRGQAQRPGNQRGENAQSGAQRGGAAPQRGAKRPAFDEKWTDAEILARMADEERIHRERLAKIEALREIARKRQQTERLSALQNLETKENQRYEATTAAGRRAVGAARFDRLFAKLKAAARARRAGAGGGGDSAPTGNPQAQRPDNGRTPQKVDEAARQGGARGQDKPTRGGGGR